MTSEPNDWFEPSKTAQSTEYYVYITKDNSMDKYVLLKELCEMIDEEIKEIKNRVLSTNNSFSQTLTAYVEGLKCAKEMATKIFWDNLDED